MIFLFPDFDTYRLALTSGVVPPAVSLAQAVGGVDADGRPWIEPLVKPTRPMVSALAKLGVTGAKSFPTLGVDLINWLQLLPVSKDPEPPVLTGQTPVLFELPDAGQLPIVVGEMMRLSNDRQSFRWLKEEEGAGTVLLRVVGPPYYTLLRALDHEEAKKTPGIRAYIERAPRVWVEIGWTHDLVEKIQPLEGQSLLLRAPRDWVFLADAPFRDIYEILDFKLPQARLDWVAVELKKRLTVPLRLIEGDRADPELWVLRKNAADQLDALARDAREVTLQRLLFAVGERDGETTIVLRVRPSKQPPPQLVLDAQAFARYLKLDNLFVPVGTKVHPVLRRDAIRKLLAEDPAQITWLEPNVDKPAYFTPESLPEDAFRPLGDWVEYVLDHDRQQLANWVQEFRFDFEPFICPEEGQEPKARPPEKVRRRREGGPEIDDAVELPRAQPQPKKKDSPAAERDEFAEMEKVVPTQLQKELTALEGKFLELPGALDDAERLKLWPELALRNAALNHQTDAALCWMNRIWEEPEANDSAVRDLARNWLRTEKVVNEGRVTLADLDRQLRRSEPSVPEVRGLCASVFWAALQKPPTEALIRRLPQVQQFLERFERSVGIRSAWLAWYAVCKTANNDALGLARIRDRLLDRLITDGLSPEHDLPNFLRNAGQRDSERMRVVRAHAMKLHESALEWCDRCEHVRATSGHYVDLIFSFGLARLGEPIASREMLKKAEEEIAARNKQKGGEETSEVHEYLLRAFRFRIEQALQGRPHIGPLPLDWREQLDQAMPKAQSASQARYFIDRMREQSQILEPQEKFDPYRDYTQNQVPELDKRLAALPDIKEPKALLATLQDLLKNGVGKPPTAEEAMSIVSEALPFSPRVGESLTLELLSKIRPVLDKLPATSADSNMLAKQALLLDRALFMAANYDRQELVRQMLQDFVVVLQRAQNHRSITTMSVVNRMFNQCLRSMRKLGMRDEIGRLIEQMSALVMHGHSVASLQATSGKDWPATVQTLLHLAAGWLFFGWTERATDALDAAKALLYTKDDRENRDGLFPQQYANLAVTYATVLGQAPIEIALSRIQEMFKRMRSLRDTFTSAKYYARLHLNIIEAVVLAVVNDDFVMGPGARRWMDDDEYLVRRRIHRDHKTLLAKAGV